MYIQRSPFEIQPPTLWYLIDCTLSQSVSVFAQQYSSTTFVSLRFYSARKKFSSFNKCHYFILLAFKKSYISLKFR